MDELKEIERKKELYKDSIDKINKRIENYKTKLDFETRTNIREHLEQVIRDEKNRIVIFQNEIEFLRPNTDNDLCYRYKVKKEFAEMVNKVVPDNCPMVFHGVNNLGVVRDIIKSGGLFTPAERGITEQSIATQIDVTCKKDIRVSCEFADTPIDSFMPYGAIFAFMPQKDEYEKVFATNGSEVPQGVKSVNFCKNPERLYGIITSPENIDRVKNWCDEYNIDSKKVFNHKQFLEKCKDLFCENNMNK